MAINIILQSDEENAQDIDDAHGVVLFYIYIRNTNNGAIKARFSMCQTLDHNFQQISASLLGAAFTASSIEN